MRVSNCP